MAPPIKAGKVSRTTEFYRKNKKARVKKAATDKKINKRPDQIKKRSELSTARRRLKRKGVNVKGKDIAHQADGSTRLQDSSKNRGAKTTSGDKRARGKK
jgi:hypothetical protein